MDYGDMYLNKIVDDSKRKKEKKGLAYWMGYSLATVFTVCLMVIVIAATYKFLLWLY